MLYGVAGLVVIETDRGSRRLCAQLIESALANVDSATLVFLNLHGYPRESMLSSSTTLTIVLSFDTLEVPRRHSMPVRYSLEACTGVPHRIFH